MRINTIVTLGASAAFGVLAIFLARGWVNDAVGQHYANSKAEVASAAAPAPKIDLVPVLVADTELGFGDQLTPQSLRLVQMPLEAVPTGSFSDFDQIFGFDGQRAAVLTRMAEGEAVLDFKITGPGGRGSLSAIISDGMRAVAVRVNDVAGVAGFITPGDHVDVMLTREVESNTKTRDEITTLIGQNLKVLGIDQNADPQSAEVDVAQAVTLEASNAQAQKLILGMSVGKLSLTLRRAGEMAVAPNLQTVIRDLNTPATTLRSQPQRIAAQRAAASAPPQAPASASVTVVRGDEHKEVSVFNEEAQLPSLAGGMQ